MNPEIKTRWVAALRSGKYKQGRRVLNRNDQEFCCLGVLCELAVEDGIVTKVPFHPEGATTPMDYRGPTDPNSDNDRNTTLVPDAVQQWAGVRLNPGVNGRPLSSMNDNGMDFNTIADYIEEYL